LEFLELFNINWIAAACIFYLLYLVEQRIYMESVVREVFSYLYFSDEEGYKKTIEKIKKVKDNQ
tara:strand:- start:1023 stop:1214 length:192 start_codon:yes stop_codon:yes gene_type:complete